MPQLEPPNSLRWAQPRSQLITLGVESLWRNEESAAVRWVLGHVRGVEVVDADREAVRVWVFADETVEPLTLVDELASCGFGAVVLGQELQVLQ